MADSQDSHTKQSKQQSKQQSQKQQLCQQQTIHPTMPVTKSRRSERHDRIAQKREAAKNMVRLI